MFFFFQYYKAKPPSKSCIKEVTRRTTGCRIRTNYDSFTNGMPRGKSVAKIFLFVSQYTF